MFAIINYGYIFGHPQPTTFASLLINHHADIVYGKITYILDDVDGDILGIYDAKTGVLTQQFVYDSDLGWLLK